MCDFGSIDVENDVNGFDVNYYALEIGSRGYIDKDNSQRLRSFIKNHCKDVKFSVVRDTISKISLVSSFIIYHSKFEKDWINPPFVRFD